MIPYDLVFLSCRNVTYPFWNGQKLVIFKRTIKIHFFSVKALIPANGKLVDDNSDFALAGYTNILLHPQVKKVIG